TIYIPRKSDQYASPPTGRASSDRRITVRSGSRYLESDTAVGGKYPRATTTLLAGQAPSDDSRKFHHLGTMGQIDKLVKILGVS
ncbi:hypothetical protein TELCIR_22493, partial [Teladorsagia circumcincta]